MHFLLSLISAGISREWERLAYNPDESLIKEILIFFDAAVEGRGAGNSTRR